MSKKIARRARLIGLVSAVVAIVVIGVLLLSGLGFDSFTRLQQLSLLRAVAVLWVVHMPLRFGGRYWSRRVTTVRKIAESFKSKSIARLL